MAGADLKIQGKLYAVAGIADVHQRRGRYGIYDRDGGVGAHDADSAGTVYHFPALYHQYICSVGTKGVTGNCAGHKKGID